MMRLDYSSISTTYPTFFRLLRRGSRFRSALSITKSLMLCSLAVLFCMALLTYVAQVLYWYAWKTSEIISSSQSLVLPFSLLISSIIGCVVGRRLRLSRALCVAATVAGLAISYYLGEAQWLSWFLLAPIVELLDSWFLNLMASESVNETAFGDGATTAGYQWISLCLWTVVGLVAGNMIRLPERRGIIRTLVIVLGTIIISIVLFGSVFYPIASTERVNNEFVSERMSELARAYSDLKKTNRTGVYSASDKDGSPVKMPKGKDTGPE